MAVLCVAVGLGMVSGCSAVRIGYNQAPTLAYWWLDGYADFVDTQTPRVREALSAWFAWHRRTQLPEYADLLAKAQIEAVADTTPERTCEWWRDLRVRVDTAVDHGLPMAAGLMITMTPQQIAHIEQRYAKFNDEYRDEYLQSDAAERLEANARRTIERAESLYGRLADTQRANIRAWLADSPFDADVWLAERQQRQRDALQMLRRSVASGATQEQAQAALRVYVGNMERSPREAYRHYNQRLTQFNCAFTARLHNSTTPVQRQAAIKKLNGWEGDLRALAADQ
ncbi:DUF6279 family lipoprotein [soil metagenome]